MHHTTLSRRHSTVRRDAVGAERATHRQDTSPLDVVGVYDTIAAADAAARLLAEHGVPVAYISVVGTAGGGRPEPPSGALVLVHSPSPHADRAREVLADAAARADDCPTCV